MVDRRPRRFGPSAAGEHLSTLAFSEKGSRNHFWATGHARATIDGVIIDADKTWVTSASEAQSYVVATGAAGIEDPVATELYLVDAFAPGIEVLGVFDGLGLCGNGSAPVRMTGLEIAADRRIGGPSGGYATMMGQTFPWFVIACSNCRVGLSGRALELACHHAATTSLGHTGERLADLGVIRARLAEAKIRHLQATALVERVTSGYAAGTIDQLSLLAVKAAAAEMSIEVTDAAMRACGGAAFSKHLPVERLFRDARAATVMGPTTDVLRDLIGRALTPTVA